MSPVASNKKRKSCDVSPYQKSPKCAKSEDGAKVLRADESENEVSSSSEPDASKHVSAVKDTKVETKAFKVGSLDRFVQITQATEVSTSCEIDPIVGSSSDPKDNKHDIGSPSECKENTPVQESASESKENTPVDPAKIKEGVQSKEEQSEEQDGDKQPDVLSSPERNETESKEESPGKHDAHDKVASTPVGSKPPKKAVIVTIQDHFNQSLCISSDITYFEEKLIHHCAPKECSL